MIGLLQRVTSAQVAVEGKIVGSIDAGILVLVGVERDDAEANAERRVALITRSKRSPSRPDKIGTTRAR